MTHQHYTPTVRRRPVVRVIRRPIYILKRPGRAKAGK